MLIPSAIRPLEALGGINAFKRIDRENIVRNTVHGLDLFLLVVPYWTNSLVGKITF